MMNAMGFSAKPQSKRDPTSDKILQKIPKILVLPPLKNEATQLKSITTSFFFVYADRILYI